MAKNELRALAFPRLDENQLAAIGRCPRTKHKHYEDGSKLFQAGQRDFSFYIVKSGKIEIVDDSEDSPKTVTVHGPGEFTGEISQLCGSPAPVTAVARAGCEAIEISPDALRELLDHHPDLSDMILQAFIARRELLRQSTTFSGVRVIGSRYSQDTFRIRDFLARNGLPFVWLDVESDPQVKDLLTRFRVKEDETPVVALGRAVLLRNPTNARLAEELGLRQLQERTVYDLVIAGAGPAGLAAAVYGASEGLKVIMLERSAPGGQAGRSMRIENYLGFPAGITGSELAERAVMQANKFRAGLAVATQIARLSFQNQYPELHLDSNETIRAKCVLIATGADYRTLNVEGCLEFEGRGVYYAATANEAQMCRAANVIVVGGGNSAGQAAVYLAGLAQHVYLVVRGDNLSKDMSSYLVHRIEDTGNIEVMLNSEIKRMAGDGHLGEVELVNKKRGETRTLQVVAVFSFIGATPRTEWLPVEIEKDAKNFVRTGPELVRSPHWSARRQPFLLETSRPGVFAAGDVRSGSVKRVASAVGEGAMAVQLVHEYLKEV